MAVGMGTHWIPIADIIGIMTASEHLPNPEMSCIAAQTGCFSVIIPHLLQNTDKVLPYHWVIISHLLPLVKTDRSIPERMMPKRSFPVKIDDFNELSALHKAILAAKYATFPDPDCADLTSSPVLAGVSNDIYDEMCRLQEKKVKGAGEEWQKWRRVKDSRGFRRQWRIAVMFARRDSFFCSSDHDTKISMAKTLLSPFTCTDAEIDEFIAQAENGGGSGLEKLVKEHDITGAMLCGCSCQDWAEGGDAHLVLGLKKGGNCDIFFGGVRRYSVNMEGQSSIADSLPAMKKHTVSSLTGIQKFEADFVTGGSTRHIVIESETAEYWI